MRDIGLMDIQMVLVLLIMPMEIDTQVTSKMVLDLVSFIVLLFRWRRSIYI